jgi:hypothetical protein
VIAALLLWGVSAQAEPSIAPDRLLVEIERRDTGAGFLSGIDGLRDSLETGGNGFESAYELVYFGGLGDDLQNRLGAGQGALVEGDSRVRLWGRSDWLSLYLSPSLAVGVSCVDGDFCSELSVNEWFVGVERGGFRVGVGAEERTLGPHDRGSLVIGRDAHPWRAISGRWRGEGAYGLVKIEGSVGMLDGERRDVSNPLIMHMDFRYSPVSWYEVGLSRLSLFGGEGRPIPPLWELLVPLNPHVEGDPDQIDADTDELAAIDMRFTVPLGVGVLQWMELWAQYGGEDMIMRSIGPLPVPSLGGVGNLFGASLRVPYGVISVERTVLMDDTFRWYEGHRIYHDGFVVDGRTIGHLHGGDAESTWFSMKSATTPYGAEGWVEQLRRVDVVDVVGENLFTTISDERSWSAGARGWLLSEADSYLTIGASVGRVTAEDNVVGGDRFTGRVWFEWSQGVK